MNRSLPVFSPLHPEGWWFITLFAVASLVLFWLWTPLGWLGIAATIACARVFQDPRRVVPVNLGLVVSPADGIIGRIDRTVPPTGLDLGREAMIRITIIMPVFGPHGIRAPIAGRVRFVLNQPPFDLAKPSGEQELALALADGRKLALVLTAAPVFGRITLGIASGEGIRTGQRLGLIRFGGSVDLYLPEGLETQVAPGQTVVAGETIMALIGQDVTARVARLD